MFRVGDRVRYHGKGAGSYNSDQRFIDADWTITALNTIGSKAIMRVTSPSYGCEMPVYWVDMELAAPAEPEPYEAWFV